jgi:hypothetical protein
LLALAVGVLCVAAAARRWHRLARAARALRPGPVNAATLRTREQAMQMAAALLGDMQAHESVSAVLEAPSRAHAVAELNELMRDAAGVLGTDAAVPRSAARVAFSAGTLLALIELARTLPGGMVSVGWVLCAFACGISSELAVRIVGRLADCRARELREAWNVFARALTRLMPAGGQAERALAPERLGRAADDWGQQLDRPARRR